MLFALTVSTLNAVLRWLNAVSIDVWVGVFFVLSLILLERPKNSILYFAQLGFTVGMLIGSKYSAWFLMVVLFLFYARRLLGYITGGRILAFFVPLSLVGLFWYVRNYVLTGNPFYPIPIVGLQGKDPFGGYTHTVWNVGFRYPVEMLNAGFGEYKIWIFGVLVAVAALLYSVLLRRQYKLSPENKLFLLGVLNFVCFLTFPTSEQTWIMVSSFRYSLPTFIPLMLGVFMLATKYHKEEWIGYIAIGNMLNVLTMAFYPKLTVVYLTLAGILILGIEQYHKSATGKPGSPTNSGRGITPEKPDDRVRKPLRH